MGRSREEGERWGGEVVLTGQLRLQGKRQRDRGRERREEREEREERDEREKREKRD